MNKIKEILRIISEYVNECESPYTKIMIRFMVGLIVVFFSLLLGLILAKLILNILCHFIICIPIIFLIFVIYFIGTILCEQSDELTLNDIINTLKDK